MFYLAAFVKNNVEIKELDCGEIFCLNLAAVGLRVGVYSAYNAAGYAIVALLPRE